MMISDCGFKHHELTRHPGFRNPNSVFRNPRARYRGSDNNDMKMPQSLLTRIAWLVVLSLTSATVTAIHAQQAPPQKPAGQVDDVVRISTELVQTDLTVLDKRGRFVEGLRADQFELSLDGKPQPISFFELVTTGSAREAAQLAAARGSAVEASDHTRIGPASDQGRVIFFFLDDVHLSGSSIIRARKALTEFVERRMNQNDQVA